MNPGGPITYGSGSRPLVARINFSPLNPLKNKIEGLGFKAQSGSVQIVMDPDPEAQKVTGSGPEHWSTLQITERNVRILNSDDWHT